jgi:hypothetical protein
MPEPQASRRLEIAALHWREFAERRHAYFKELYESGRWSLFYSQDDFVARAREVVATADLWASIAPSPAEQLKKLADRIRSSMPELESASEVTAAKDVAA